MKRHKGPQGVKHPPYKVGELAQLAGVSVRTLHHYEDIGLLRPSRRTQSGHRLYERADVERLARIRALTQLGLSLEQVRGCLEDEKFSPLRLVELHLARVREVLAEQQALAERLMRLREHIVARGDDVSSLLETLEVMTLIEKYFTEEQRRALAERREALGEEAIRETKRAWEDLFFALKVEMDKGSAPESDEVLALARKAKELIARFTGGDPGLQSSLHRMYAEQPVQKIIPGMDPALFAYFGKALSALPKEDADESEQEGKS